MCVSLPVSDAESQGWKAFLTVLVKFVKKRWGRTKSTARSSLTVIIYAVVIDIVIRSVCTLEQELQNGFRCWLQLYAYPTERHVDYNFMHLQWKGHVKHGDKNKTFQWLEWNWGVMKIIDQLVYPTILASCIRELVNPKWIHQHSHWKELTDKRNKETYKVHSELHKRQDIVKLAFTDIICSRVIESLLSYKPVDHWGHCNYHW